MKVFGSFVEQLRRVAKSGDEPLIEPHLVQWRLTLINQDFSPLIRFAGEVLLQTRTEKVGGHQTLSMTSVFE